MPNIARLRQFVQAFTRLVEDAAYDEERAFGDGRSLLSALIDHDDWLPDTFAKPDANRYQQYLLYCDPLERFSVASFVWSPGQATPVHDHTVWGMVGVMRGAEYCEEFEADETSGELRAVDKHNVGVGSIDLVSPRVGDIHRVSNALKDQPSVSIHVYGANIGAVQRHIYDVPSGEKQRFVSGYSNNVIPNIWDKSLETPAVKAAG